MNDQTGKLKVAITGASGLVGSDLVEHFLQAGLNVIAVVRSVPDHLQAIVDSYYSSSSSGSSSGDGPGSILVRNAEVKDVEALKRAFAGCDVVVHAAGTVDPFGERETIFAINCGGTVNALAAAKSVGVKQFILISSLSVITGQGDQFNLDESAPYRPCGESYADSKIEAEKAVVAESAGNEIKVTVLRPGFIYGPRERSWMPRLINSIANGKAMLIDGGTRQTNVIYVGNLSRAVKLALMNEKAFGQVYNLTDGQTVTKKDLFDSIADGLNLPRVTKKIPRPVAKAACSVISAIAPTLSKETQKKLARFSRAAFRLAGVNQGFSIAKAESELQYTTRVPFKEGMARTLTTFKANASRDLVGSKAQRN